MMKVKLIIKIIILKYYFKWPDETADLLNELNKIKAEREEERKIEEVKKQEEEERIRTENILR